MALAGRQASGEHAEGQRALPARVEDLDRRPDDRVLRQLLLHQHWRIEIDLHFVRDVTFGEDRARLRTGHAPQVVAAVRNLALTLIRRTGATAIAAARRAFHPLRALGLLTATLSTP